MKKITLSFILGLSALTMFNTSYGQLPSITSANQIHSVGDSISYIDANSFGFDPIPAGGANVNWDYSTLMNSGGISYIYEDPSTTTGNGNFPTANEAMANSNAAGHEWFESNASEIKRLGFTDPVNGDIFYHGGGFVRYQFPFEPGNTWFTPLYSASTTINFGLGEDSTAIQNGSYSATVDAYGTVTLPSGVVTDVVRVHVVESFDLNVFMLGVPVVSQNVVDDYYFWFNDNIKDPILIYGTTTSGGSVTTVLRYQSVGTTSIEDVNITETISLYPNPAKDMVTVNTSMNNGSYIIAVIDILGEVVSEEAVQVSGNILKKEMNISNLNKGIYFIKISNERNQITKKIIVE